MWQAILCQALSGGSGSGGGEGAGGDSSKGGGGGLRLAGGAVHASARQRGGLREASAVHGGGCVRQRGESLELARAPAVYEEPRARGRAVQVETCVYKPACDAVCCYHVLLH